jgi:hypothetical protein
LAEIDFVFASVAGWVFRVGVVDTGAEVELVVALVALVELKGVNCPEILFSAD